MTTQHPDGTTPDGPDPDLTTTAHDSAPGDSVSGTGEPTGEQVVPAKQIHRWKGEGGALHPDE